MPTQVGPSSSDVRDPEPTKKELTDAEKVDPMQIYLASLVSFLALLAWSSWPMGAVQI